MLTCIHVLILLPLTFLTIVLKTLFSSAELAAIGIYLEDSWTTPSQPATPREILNEEMSAFYIHEAPIHERVMC